MRRRERERGGRRFVLRRMRERETLCLRRVGYHK